MGLFLNTPAPLFRAPSKVNPSFSFRSVAGRFVLLAFLPPPGAERDAALAVIRSQAARFDDDRRVFFGILPDQASFDLAPDTPPLRWFLDADGDLRRSYQVVDEAGDLVPTWIALDPSLRVMGTAPLAQSQRAVSRFLDLGDPQDHAGVPLHAPVLIVPRILERDLCRQLIDYYETHGGRPSGVMRERNGKTVGELDDFKRRYDAQIQDDDLVTQIRIRLRWRLIPEIEKAFGFTATRVERYIVARYAAEDGGYFRPHTDNNTPGTAHRKFAVSINLNAEEFEGGDLCFPEFGPRTYRPPTGGAVVFSCSLLHEARPVTRGVRYATLPFLYDAEGERVRTANLHTFADS